MLLACDLSTLLATVILNGCIFKALRTSTGSITERSQFRRRFVKEQRNIAMMVIVNTVVFFCFVLFNDFYHLYWYCKFDFNVWLYISSICSLLNSLLNPIIYNIFGSTFRAAFFKSFPFIKRIVSKLIPRRDSARETTCELTQFSQC